ncbi:MAG: hypothetical protein E7616_06985 [Ruminococcaceae bacterium]|nr:hypothetical protein [Oscillospiraceae bacterium]
MVYRSGFSRYALMGVVSGMVYGILMGLFNQSLIEGILMGILFAILFPLCMFAVSLFTGRKYAKKRAAIQAERAVFCDGEATHNGNGGWLFLTAAGLEFYPHSFNLNRSEYTLALTDIRGAIVKSNHMVVFICYGANVEFTVAKPKAWAGQVNDAIARLQSDISKDR